MGVSQQTVMKMLDFNWSKIMDPNKSPANSASFSKYQLASAYIDVIGFCF